ncbi:MAG TPA: hypothetical protein VHB79_04540 [Polyangiaceae bacterium]|nr:hypothetical protein [Polyangiaceae bacterium]
MTLGHCKVLRLGDSITFGTPTNNGAYRVAGAPREQWVSKKRGA